MEGYITFKEWKYHEHEVTFPNMREYFVHISVGIMLLLE